MMVLQIRTGKAQGTDQHESQYHVCYASSIALCLLFLYLNFKVLDSARDLPGWVGNPETDSSRR